MNEEVDVAAATAALRTIPEGKVPDYITGRLLNDTPEEYVRQNVARSLVLEYGYDRSQISVEFPIKVGSSTKRVDLAIFPESHQHYQANIWIAIETKKPGTKSDAKKDGVDQLKSYMAACLNCEYGMWTNGDERLCYLKSATQTTTKFIDAIDIPAHGIKTVAAPSRDTLRPATGHNLLFAFRRCHNYIAGNQGLHKADAFWELLKVIFAKIEDERSDKEKLSFYVSQKERSSMDLQNRVKTRLQKLFQSTVVKKYPSIFTDNSRLEMTPGVLAYVVSELQQYSLLDSSVDVKGVAYEEILGSNLRGDRGEFFTPRNACQMAVHMLAPRPDERILDPACGTGGFLVTAMNYALESIDQKHKQRWPKNGPRQSQLEEYFGDRHSYLASKVFGLDLNPNLVRASKMNMVMNNDGSGNLFQCNSLEHPHKWSAEVNSSAPLESIDVLFTNPPFGTRITIDDTRVLGQYDVAHVWDEKEGIFSLRQKADGRPILQSYQPPEVLFVERCLQFLRPGGRMAIVLPNGLLNNPGQRAFRSRILAKAQLLAVVDMHRDLFQPHNDTQTSLVFLRKWDTRRPDEPREDYPVFMAVADKIGHDRRGNTIYQRNPDGTLQLREITRRVSRYTDDGTIEELQVSNEDPIVDDDMPAIVTAYRRWLEQNADQTPDSYQETS